MLLLKQIIPCDKIVLYEGLIENIISNKMFDFNLQGGNKENENFLGINFFFNPSLNKNNELFFNSLRFRNRNVVRYLNEYLNMLFTKNKVELLSTKLKIMEKIYKLTQNRKKIENIDLILESKITHIISTLNSEINSLKENIFSYKKTLEFELNYKVLELGEGFIITLNSLPKNSIEFFKYSYNHRLKKSFHVHANLKYNFHENASESGWTGGLSFSFNNIDFLSREYYYQYSIIVQAYEKLKKKTIVYNSSYEIIREQDEKLKSNIVKRILLIDALLTSKKNIDIKEIFHQANSLFNCLLMVFSNYEMLIESTLDLVKEADLHEIGDVEFKVTNLEIDYLKQKLLKVFSKIL